MHLVLVTTSYPDKTPGSEAAGSFVEDLALELASYISVTILAPGTESSTSHDKKLTVVRFKAPRLPLSLLKARKPSDWPAIFKTLVNGKKTLREIFEKQHIDHILALWALPSGYWARYLSKRHNIPYSIWTLGSDIWTLGNIPVINMILRRVIGDSAYCYSDGLILRYDTEALSNKKCEFLPSARKLQPPPKKHLSHPPPYNLLFIGRWHPNKGIDLMLESLSMLDQSDWNKINKITICGGGPLEAQVKTMCEQLKNKGHPIVVNGFVDKDTAALLISESDYLLIPSRIESIPVIFSDAMQCTCPVIATPVGDLPRLIHEFDVGFVSSDISSTSFTASIKESLNTSPKDFEPGTHKAKSVFNIEHIAQTILKSLSLNKESAR
jgi:glycosyltransferase involved in cell wall biosynthesis